MKAISHIERINDIKYQCSPLDKTPLTTIKRLQSTRELNEKTNRLVKKTKEVTVDRFEEMKHYRVDDFSLDNMIAAGVELKPTNLNKNRLEICDSIQ